MVGTKGSNFFVCFHFLYLGVPVKQSLKYEIRTVMDTYGEAVFHATEAFVKKKGLKKAKAYLVTLRSEMRTELETVKEDAALSPAVRKYLVFPEIALLQKLVEGLPKAKQFLQKFVKERDQLYGKVLLKNFVTEVKEKSKELHVGAKVNLLRKS